MTTNAFLRGPNWRASSLSRRPRTVDVDGVGKSDMEGENLRAEKRRSKGIGILKSFPPLPLSIVLHKTLLESLPERSHHPGSVQGQPSGFAGIGAERVTIGVTNT